jgi:asparagine synthase (glutamine-hydrolysing)
MTSSDGRYVITFNGEIYNHAELRQQLSPSGGRWCGSSDTETLVEAYRAWGVGCLQRLQGMFAFGIWDKVERRLFVARDRLGVKPLYYSWRDGTFAFGSRPGVVAPLAGPGAFEINPQSLRLFLELGYIPSPLSFYRDVVKLGAAHYALVDEGSLRVVRYWDYRHITPDPSLLKRSEADLVDELDDLVSKAVRARLMSDVPLGAFLSGGVDSAMVFAAMKAAGVSQPKAFTIAFKESEYNEGPAAARIAQHFQVDHVMETLSVEDLLALLPQYVEEFDEPFADSSSFPTMAVARLARRHVTVALTGDGGDELFGGYHYYSLVQRLSRINRLPPRLRRLLQMACNAVPLHKAKLLAGALDRSGPAEIFNYLRSYGKDFPPLVGSDVLQSTEPSSNWFEQVAASCAMDLSPAELGMRLDLGLTLSEGYLQKVDVSTMAFSLEARCPFVDYRLVEWSMRLPLHFKIRGNETKYLLKKALCRHLPAELVYRPKRGFGVPIARWLRGPLRGWAEELIHDSSVMSRLPLDRSAIQDLFKLHAAGKRDAHPVLWATLMLLCFVARHDRGMELPATPVQRAA